MSTILDALKKVERERESPGDRLRHEPEPTPPRSRRVSTVMIVVCALLGFGGGAGIELLWRNAAPTPAKGPGTLAVPAAPHIEVPAASADAPPVDAARRVARAQPEVDEESALEPSPFARPAPPSDELAAAEVPGLPPATEFDEIAPEAKVAAGVRPFDRRDDIPAGDEIAPEAKVVAGVRPFERPEDIPAIDGTGFPDDEPLEGEAAAIVDEPVPETPEATIIDTGRSPPGAPRVTLSFLQYSADPARRFAFVSVEGGPSQRVREGDAAGEASVDLITPDGVRLRHADMVFVIRPRH